MRGGVEPSGRASFRNCKNCFKKFVAFTLAETLIVMGIIGIVSALTLPNLNSSTGEKEKVAKVKKIYQNLDDAIGRAQAVYGPLNEWFVNDSSATAQATRFGDRLTEFMKVSKNCNVTTNQKCFSSSNVTYISGSSSLSDIDGSNTSYKFVLADGTSVALDHRDVNQYYVYFNIDGIKGKNKIGADVFSVIVNANNPENPISTSEYQLGDILTTGNGFGATFWVLNYDNMDYLKAGTNGKCNNSNVTLNSFASPPVTSCK